MFKLIYRIKNFFLFFFTSRILIIILIISSSQISIFNRDFKGGVIRHVESNISKEKSINHLKRSLSIGDSGYYLKIAENGYTNKRFSSATQENWAFFPLFPYTIKIVNWLIDNPLYSAMIISNITFLAALYFFGALLHLEGFDKSTIVFSYSLICFAPLSYFFFIPVTESIFFLLSTLAFYFAKKNKTVQSSLFISLATATRATGILILPAYAYYQIRKLLNNKINFKDFVISMLIAPLGVITFMILLYNKTGNALAFLDIQKTWGREIANPYYGFKSAILSYTNILSDWNFNLLNITSILLAICAVIYFSLTKRIYYALFIACPIFIAISTGSTQSISRFLTALFPFYIFLAEICDTETKRLIAFGASCLLFGICAVFYGMSVTAFMS